MKRSSKFLTWTLVISMLFALCSCSNTESTKRNRDEDSDHTRSERQVDDDKDPEPEVTVESETESEESDIKPSAINLSTKEAVELAISCFDVSADDATQRMLLGLGINEYKRMDTGDGRYTCTTRTLTNFDKKLFIDGSEFKCIKIISGSTNRRVFDITFEMGDIMIIVNTDEDAAKLGEYYNLPVEEAYNAIYPEMLSVYGDPYEDTDRAADFDADIFKVAKWDLGENKVFFTCQKNKNAVEGNNQLSIEIRGINIGDHEPLPKPPLADEIRLVSDMLTTAVGKDFDTAKSIFEEFYGKELTVKKEEKNADGVSYTCTTTNRIHVGDTQFVCIRFDCKADGTVFAIIYINDIEVEERATAYYQNYVDAFTEVYGSPSTPEDSYNPYYYSANEYKADNGCIMFIVYEMKSPINYEDSNTLYFGCKLA